MNNQGKQLASALGAILAALQWIMAVGVVLVTFAVAFYLATSGFSPDVLGSDAPTLSDETRAMGISPMLLGIASGAVLLVIVVQLRRLMRSVTAGAPFDPCNVGRLRTIAAAIAGLELLPYLMLLPIVPVAARGSMDFGFDFKPWLSVFVILVLAEVFREGARLREDADMTV